MDNRPYIVGNWKMNGMRASLAEARAIDRVAVRFPKVEVGLAPPFTLIHATRDAVESLRVGAQDVHFEESGAFTGDISAPMAADAGADFTILGHSERREWHVESNAFIKKKCEAARETGLAVILCVGESEATRDAGDAVSFVTGQLEESLPRNDGATDKLAIAYEPIWAIGTGRVPSVEDIREMHKAIRAKLVEIFGEETGAAIRILYGGSVNGDNATELLAVEEVGGALVGGASLSNESFGAIIMAAATLDD